MDDSQILLELLHEDALIEHGDDYGRPFVKLAEPDVLGSVAVVRNIPEDAVVIKTDQFPAPLQFFKGSKNENKRADFMIISPSKKVVLYIELKAGKKESSFVEKQLKGAACVFAYCKEVGQRFWGRCEFLEGYEHRFVGIVNTSIDLQPSRQQKNQGAVHDTPQNFLKLSSPNHLQFRKLAAL